MAREVFDIAIRLQSNSDRCIYEQIYDYIKNEILEGRLSAGERLPSTRSMSEYIQVSRSTVGLAYEQLSSEGYIESKPYSGYFVCSIEGLYNLRQETPGINLGVACPSDSSEVSDRSSVKADIKYDFSPNGMEISKFPFGVWRKITKDVLDFNGDKLFSKGDAKGEPELRNTICRYLYSSRGVRCNPDQIIIGAGNDYLLMLLEKILGPGMKVAIENPTYLRAYKIFKSFGYEVFPFENQESGIGRRELEDCESNLAYVMPTHQFPTGQIMSAARRSEMLGWANERADRYIIEDDYDSEFRYKGRPIPALQSLDKNGKVIYIGTFSKAIAPSIRVSYMVLPESLMEKYERNLAFFSCTVSRIDQCVLNEFISEGYFERYLNKMRKVYKDKHDFLIERIKEFSNSNKNLKMEIIGENAGLHILLRVCDECKGDDEKLNQLAYQRGVKLYPINQYYTSGRCAQPTFLLGFGGLNKEEIAEGIEALKAAWS